MHFSAEMCIDEARWNNWRSIRLYLEVILNGKVDLLTTNEELSIITFSWVQLSWEQPACVIDKSGYYISWAAPWMYSHLIVLICLEGETTTKMLSDSYLENANFQTFLGSCPRPSQCWHAMLACMLHTQFECIS